MGKIQQGSKRQQQCEVQTKKVRHWLDYRRKWKSAFLTGGE
nr:MAG TPA: hypothetical protein [Caudoviricetes sp.]